MTDHTDANGQFTSFAFIQRLIDAGMDGSVGSVGDACDKALAESQIGTSKTELIRTEGSGATSSSSLSTGSNGSTTSAPTARSTT